MRVIAGENTATRNTPHDIEPVRPKAAASATSCGRSRWPAFSATKPVECLRLRAHIGTGLEARGKHDLVALDADVFLHEHGIGTFGHRRASEDAHRLPGREQCRCGTAA
jgi:hypothetical protein